MAAHRYWRITGVMTTEAQTLELSEARLYVAGAAADDAALLTCTAEPDSGVIASLKDASTSGVVSWSAAKYSSPGFALKWDFGSGTTADVNEIRLGSGSSSVTFPSSLSLEWSDTGMYWTAFKTAAFIKYPGALSLTDAPSVPGVTPDALDPSVVFRSAYETGFLDSSVKQRSMTPTATGASLSTDKPLYGAKSLKLTGGYVSSLSSEDFAFGTGDFCIDFYAWKSADATDAYDCVMTTDTSNGSAVNGWFLELSSVRGLVWANYGGLTLQAGATVNDSAWHHWAITRSGSTLRAFRDGLVIFSGSNSTNVLAVGQFGIGGSAVFGYRFSGYLKNVRVTKGAARYTAAFTPTGFNEVDPDAFPIMSTAAAMPMFSKIPNTKRVVGSNFGASKFLLQPLQFTFRDPVHGGSGVIAGTVKEKSTPTNIPLRRKVLLIDEPSQVVIRQTWSDATTGAYTFKGVRESSRYTVLAYDNLRNYRAVIADNLMPELMPGALP